MKHPNKIGATDQEVARKNLSACARKLPKLQIINGKIINKPTDMLKAMGVDVID